MSSALFAYKNPRLGIPLTVFVVVEIYIAASAADWWGGAAFGARRLVSLMPPLAIAFAATLMWSPKGIRLVTLVVSGFLVLWNSVLVDAYRWGYIDDYEPVNLLTEAPGLLLARLGERSAVSEILMISYTDGKRLILILAILVLGLAYRRAELIERNPSPV